MRSLSLQQGTISVTVQLKLALMSHQRACIADLQCITVIVGIPPSFRRSYQSSRRRQCASSEILYPQGRPAASTWRLNIIPGRRSEYIPKTIAKSASIDTRASPGAPHLAARPLPAVLVRNAGPRRSRQIARPRVQRRTTKDPTMSPQATPNRVIQRQRQ